MNNSEVIVMVGGIIVISKNASYAEISNFLCVSLHHCILFTNAIGHLVLYHVYSKVRNRSGYFVWNTSSCSHDHRTEGVSGDIIHPHLSSHDRMNRK